MFKVILLPRAEDELDRQLDYLCQRSPSGAEAWASQYEAAIQRVSNDPESCGLAPESDDHPDEIRQAIFKTQKGNRYRLIFTIRVECVYVLSIRGLGQDLVSF